MYKINQKIDTKISKANLGPSLSRCKAGKTKLLHYSPILRNALLSQQDMELDEITAGPKPLHLVLVIGYWYTLIIDWRVVDPSRFV